jgi:hypothetical protein
MFIVTTPQEKLLFRNVDDLFVCGVGRDFIKLNQSQSYLVKSDVTKLKYTAIRFVSTDEAQLYQGETRIPPAAASGVQTFATWRNFCVCRAEKIYGESEYGLKGRMSHRKPNTTTNVEHFQSLVD